MNATTVHVRDRIARVAGSVRHAGRVLAVAGRRRRPRAVFALATLGYLVAFAYALGDLRFGGTDLGLTVVDAPLARAFEPGPGSFTFEGVAVVEFGAGALLFSPLNLLLGLGLAGLVGANLALSYLAIAQPRSCGIGAGTGVLAAVPALLGGSACCAPVLLVVLGIQAGGVLASAIGWLLPVGVALLVGTLVYVAGKVDLVTLQSASDAEAPSSSP